MLQTRNAECAERAELCRIAATGRVKREATPRRNPLRALRSVRSLFVIMAVAGFSRTAAAQAPRQAVIDTSAGTVIIDLAPEAAPNQVAYFIQAAQQGGYDGTVFHRAIKYGMVQGGGRPATSIRLKP